MAMSMSRGEAWRQNSGQKPFPLTVAKQGQQSPSLGIAYGGGGICSCGFFVTLLKAQERRQNHEGVLLLHGAINYYFNIVET